MKPRKVTPSDGKPKPRRKYAPKKAHWDKSKSADYKGITFASMFERDFAQQLDKIGMKWEYETDTFYWFPNPKIYKPDFKIIRDDGSYYYIETKGFFDPDSRVKMAAIKKQFPEEDIRIVFDNPDKKLSKLENARTYREWADRYSYPCSSFCIPMDWR